MNHKGEEKTTITLPLCDDFHLHLRDGDQLPFTLAASSKSFKRCLVMPNIQPPATNMKRIREYYDRICSEIKKSQLGLEPLMTIYLTEETTKQDIQQAKSSGIVYAAKLYMAGSTTHSQSGVYDIKKIYPILKVCQDESLPVAIHGEVADETIDVFEREQVFVEKILKPLVQKFPNLKMILEHVTSKVAVDFVLNCPSKNVAATITAHHLLANRNQLFHPGMKLNPHCYCLPILKSESDRQALLKAATSGSPQFFAGTDSAPHEKNSKESGLAPAGCFTAPFAVELYATAFEEVGALDKLESFLCVNGAQFYQLPALDKTNKTQIRLIRQSWKIPSSYQFGEKNEQVVVPFWAGRTLNWLSSILTLMQSQI